MRLISQLTNGISRVFQKLLNYFNNTMISISFVPPSPVWPVIFWLNKIETLLSLLLGKSIIVSRLFEDVLSLQHYDRCFPIIITTFH